jgi:hypothetical protein
MTRRFVVLPTRSDVEVRVADELLTEIVLAVSARGRADVVVTGGTVGLIYGFSGDSGEVRFSVTHDGVSSEVVIEYSTRAD